MRRNIAGALAALVLATGAAGAQEVSDEQKAAAQVCLDAAESFGERMACFSYSGELPEPEAEDAPEDGAAALDALDGMLDEMPAEDGEDPSGTDDSPEAGIAAAGAGATVFDPGLLESCFANAQGRLAETACIGVAADYCIAHMATDSYEKIIGCYAAERDRWFTRTQETLAAIREHEGDPEALASTLEAFDLWTRRFCEYEGRVWGEQLGTELSVRTQCEMNQAAALSLFLESHRYD